MESSSCMLELRNLATRGYWLKILTLVGYIYFGKQYDLLQ